jgi:hypothetical protein
MTTALQTAATLVAAAALVAALSALVSTRRVGVALPVLLDLLLAAGLLHLAAVEGWRGIAAAAAIVVIRRVVTSAFRHGSREGRPSATAQ